MANGNFNNQFPVYTSGCGAPTNVPGVAVFNQEVTCPTSGQASSTFAAPATTLVEGLVAPVAKFTIATSTAARRIAIGDIGDLSVACEELIVAEVGGAISDICDPAVATPNAAAKHLCCGLDLGSKFLLGLVAKTSSELSGLSATQILFDPCNPCFSSATDFICANGCGDNSNFLLNRAIVGRNAIVVIDVPANVALTLSVCTCAVERTAYSTCPTSSPAYAEVVSAPACPPQQQFAQSAQPFNGR